MKSTIGWILAAMILLLSSCGKQKVSGSASGHVIVVNEGGYRHGDASVSVYDPTAKAVVNDVFQTQNGFALGDVAQSVHMVGDTAYIVLNYSKDIVIANAADNFRYLGHIAMPNTSPRYFLPVSSSKAYVTELYAHKIWILDYRSGVVTGSISVAGWTEQLLSDGGKVYVLEQTAPSETPVHKLLMIDPTNDQITNELNLATDPGSMVLTDDHKLWVLTSQQSGPAEQAALYQIDPQSLSVLRKLDFDSAATPSYLRYSSFAHQLLFSMNGIYKMSQNDSALPDTAFITSDHWNVYGLNADPDNGDVYISDAIDYQQASHIMRYTKDGSRVDAFNAGIISNGFVFR